MIDGAYILHEEEGAKIIERPYWPKGQSGVTLPGGYDLGQQSAATFRADWNALPAHALAILEKCIGAKGEAAGILAAQPDVRQITILPALALDVFNAKTLPRYITLARATFPGLELLPDPVQTALTSLCFNRGGLPVSAIPKDGASSDTDRHDATRGIRNAVAAGNVPLIAQYLDVMGEDGPGTLWPGSASPNPGLRARRKREARLVRSSYPKGAAA